MSAVSSGILAGVATVTIDRPTRRNAVDAAACDAIAAAVDHAVRAGAGVVILTGAGGTFCAGADLNGVQDAGFRGAISACLAALRAAPIVTIAAVDGVALGAGTQLAVACDLRVATPGARFGIPAAKLGLMVDHWTVQQLVSLAGAGPARAMLLAAEEITGGRAYELGLVNRVGGLEVATEWAQHITDLAPLTIAGHKLALNRLDSEPDDEDVRAAISAAWASRDLEEGRAAFAQKRAPRFTGS